MGIAVIALERCHDGVKFVEEGETFVVPDDTFEPKPLILDGNRVFKTEVDEAGNEKRVPVLHPLPTAYKPLNAEDAKPKVKAPKAKAPKAESELA